MKTIKKKRAVKESEERCEARSSSLFGDEDDDYYQEQARRNVAINKQEFEEVEQTSEFMETHYFKQTNLDSARYLISMSQFWADYANYLLNPLAKRGAFISDNFIDCFGSKQQIFLIQFILDLPANATSDH